MSRVDVRGGISRRVWTFIPLLLVAILGLSACGSGSEKETPAPASPSAPQPAAPVIATFVASASSVNALGSVTLTWTTSGATSCIAQGDWSGNKSLQGSETVGPLLESADLTLSCTGAGGSVSSQVAVTVVPNPGATAIAQLSPNVRVLDAVDTSLIVEITETRVTFNGPVTLTPGEVIIAGESAYKVTAVELFNGQTLATVVPPTIEELFDKLTISGTFELDANTPQEPVEGANARSRPQAAKAFASQAAGNAASVVYDISAPSLTVTGDATLNASFVADIDYDKANGGFRRSHFAVTSSVNAQATIAVKSSASVTSDKLLTSFRVPIPLTIVDGALRLIGVNLASIYVPVFAGVNVSSDFEFGLNTQSNTAARLRLDFGGGNPVEGTFSYDPPTFTASGLTAAPAPNAVALATANLSTFAYVGIRPAFAILNTVALVGLDTKVGPVSTSTLQFLPQSTPPYCLQAQLGVRGSANGYVAIAGARRATDPQTVSLISLSPQQLGDCESRSSLTLRVESTTPPTVFTPLTVFVSVTSPAAAGGSVQVSLDGATCTAALSASGAGSCILTPTMAGSRQIQGSFGGGSGSGSANASQSVEIAKAATTTQLVTEPGSSDVGALVSFKGTITATPTGTPAPTGTVSVRNEAGEAVCEAEVDSTGVASCTTRLNQAGAFVFRATFAGDDYYETSSSADWTHHVGQSQSVQGRGRVSVGYDTRASNPCEIFGFGPEPQCSATDTGAFDLSVSDTVVVEDVGSFTVSASSRGGAVLSGTIADGAYTGFLEANLRNAPLSGVTSQAGNGWSLEIVIPRATQYELAIDLSIEKQGSSLPQCFGVMIAAFQLIEDGDVEDAQGIGVNAGGICGSRAAWPTQRRATYSGTLPPGTYRLMMSFNDPTYPDPVDWNPGTEFGQPLTLREQGSMSADGTIVLRLRQVP